MNCAACSSNIERTVKKISGVDFCSVSLITGRMEVSGDFSPDSVIQAVRKLGYGISVIGDNESYDYSLKGLSPSLAPMIKRFLWSLVFLLPLMYLTMGHHLFGWPVGSYYTLNIDQLAYAELILASVIMAINIRLFLKGLTGLLELKPNMESLVAIGVGAAFMYSTMKVFQMNVYLSLGRYNLMESTVNSLYYESSAMLLTIVSFGRILENFARNKATREIRLLLNRAPKTAHRVLTDDDGYTPADGSPTTLYLKNLVTEDIDASTLTRGEVFIVKTGEIIPADAVVLAGRCSIDESAISGEPLPRDVEPGMHVIGSTINTSGIISCRTERSGAETIYSQIVSMVCRAISDKAPIASIADRVSAVFVPAVIVLSIITFICWFLIFNYGITTSLKYAVSVLLVSCPCALGLATPIAITVATGKGLRSGLLFKTATALENLGKISNIALDKTGTLTSGKLTVGKITSLNSGLTEEDIIYLAAVMESGSCHPLAGAIKDTAVKMTGSLSLPDEVIINRISDYLVSSGNGNHISRIAITSLTETPGFGIRARINDVPFTIGRPASLLNSGAYSNSDRVESVIRNLSFGHKVRDHRSAGDPADHLAVAIDFHAVTHDAAIDERDRTHALGQRRHRFGRIVLRLEGSLRLRLLCQRFAADEVALFRNEGDREFRKREREDRHRFARFVHAHFIAVQRQHAFHAQRVARAEPRRLAAELDQTVPRPYGVFVFDEQLVADRFRSVARSGDEDLMTLHHQRGQVVARGLGDLVDAGKGLQDLFAVGSLNRDRDRLVRDVFDRAVIVLHDRRKPCKVLVRVGRVDDEQEAIRLEPVQVRVVDRAAVLGGYDAVLRLIDVERKHVARKHMLQKRDALRSFDDQASHVGYVEEPAMASGVQMLRKDAFRILDRHFPTAEIDHRRAGFDVFAVQ